METKASSKYIRISARKARLVVDLIRGKDVAEAQQILDYSDKAAARVVSKILNSAIANAEHNNGLNADELYVSRAFVDEGPTLKRFRPRAMGRATRINKRTCHITLVLDEREPSKEGKRRRFIRRPSRRAKVAAEEAQVTEELEEEELEELEGEETAEAEPEAAEAEEEDTDEAAEAEEEESGKAAEAEEEESGKAAEAEEEESGKAGEGKDAESED